MEVGDVQRVDLFHHRDERVRRSALTKKCGPDLSGPQVEGVLRCYFGATAVESARIKDL